MEGYYNNTIFHRLIPEFIVQGGDPTGQGQGGQSIYGQPFKVIKKIIFINLITRKHNIFRMNFIKDYGLAGVGLLQWLTVASKTIMVVNFFLHWVLVQSYRKSIQYLQR